MNQLSLLPNLSGADFSECGKYRYQLLRGWDLSKPTFTYIGVNPSIAGLESSDATTTRNLKRVMKLGASKFYSAVFADKQHGREKPIHADFVGIEAGLNCFFYQFDNLSCLFFRVF
ncbi:MAG: DUF1643 domain-containing protein [Thaumarchaeota archaeon]|nr:DUF1643 domain-containing protein [Nitrososphaerota archaeon]